LADLLFDGIECGNDQNTLKFGEAGWLLQKRLERFEYKANAEIWFLNAPAGRGNKPDYHSRNAR
jgi:hypothetical protein